MMKNREHSKRAIHYLETSALNLLADELSDFDFNSMIQHIMHVDWCISPTVLWEIFLNSAPDRRDYLIYWAQFNCADYLLKSPSEIIVSFIEHDTPLSDRKRNWFNRESELNIAKVWSRIHRKIDRTIPIELEKLLDHSLGIRMLSKKWSKTLTEMTDPNWDGYHDEYFQKQMKQVLEQALKFGIWDDGSGIKLSMTFEEEFFLF